MLLQGKTHWIKEGLSLPKMSQQSCSESTKYNRSDWEWLPKLRSREGIPSIYVPLRLLWGFPSACNVRELGSISGLGRSPGEEKGYPLQYSAGEFYGLYSPWGHRESDATERFSLAGFPSGSAGKESLPAIQETWVWSLAWEDPLEKGTVTHSSILAWRNQIISPWGHKQSDMTEWLSLSHTHRKPKYILMWLGI